MKLIHVQVLEGQGKPLTCASARLELTWQPCLTVTVQPFSKQRALHMGLSPEVLRQFVDKGFHNMALFAFSCNYAPGAASDKPFTDMLEATMGREPNAAELSILRRLFNESYANVAADIESQVKQTDESVSRHLAPAERAERLRIQQKKLAGLAIRGQYEPADALVDKCCAAYESDRLSYVEWSLCISREYELANNVKKDADLSFNSDGTLKLARTSKIEPMQGCQRSKCATHWCVGDWHWIKRTFWTIPTMTSLLSCCWMFVCKSPQLDISVCQ